MEKAIFDEMIATRRKLHQRPEEGWTEFETEALVVERLKGLGCFEILLGKQVVNPDAVMGRDPELVKKAVARALEHGVPQSLIDATEGYTGVVAVLKTGRPGPVTAFRCDMDCVLVEESTDKGHVPAAEGFASCRPGFMHACGHDSHTSVMLAVARWLSEHKDELCGTVKLIFQPAEEGVRGAAAMAASGVVDDVDQLIGAHVGTSAKLGEVAVKAAGFLASTKIDIHFEGVPSHAGSDPEKGRSALMAACATAMMMQGIPRHGEGATRVSVGRLVAGEGRNVTPVHAFMQTEVRGETGEINEYMVENVRRIVEGAARAYDVKGRIEKAGEATTLIDNPELDEVIRAAAEETEGVKRVFVDTKPAGSEDCTMLIRRVVEHGGRGGYFLFGCNHHGHHRSDFEIQDTVSMPVGFGVFVNLAKRLNGVKKA
jgi:aminobenzoyl-glutamate utilization protein A